MNNDTLELTELSQNIYFKKIWETTSTYQVGYELTVPIEKLNNFDLVEKLDKIYLLKYSHISINGEIHPLEAIKGECVFHRQRKCAKLVFECEHKEVNHNEKNYNQSYYKHY